jgi:outer membrane protein OmpA-like peptidoglycan-associated protein
MTFDPFADPFRFGGAPSTADIFKRYRGGGGRGPRKPETPSEPEAEALPAETPPAEEKQEKVVLRNPKWESEEVGFNEEAEVSVEATVPEAHAHKTRVAFELFAKTPKGPERISQAEGQIKDGKALAKVPVYIPQYRDEEGNFLAVVEYYFTAKHSLSDLLLDDTVVKKVDHLADRLIKSHILQNVTFGYDRSFLRPAKAPQLKALCEEIKAWKEEHPDGKLAVFGHADAAGDEGYNKKLSERRAKAVHAFLVKDPAAWESLYKEEKWDLRTTQELLGHLGHDPGPVDGQMGPKTRAALESFQSKAGLTVDGDAGPKTREALYKAFMDGCNPLELKAKEFDSIDGQPTSGCSEINQVEKNDGACEANRRVAVFLLKSNKNFPIQYPCKQGDVETCKKQAARKGERRTPGFTCLFYDQLVVEVANSGGGEEPPSGDGILELAWDKPSLVAWDDTDKPEMKTKVRVKTQTLPPCDDAVLEIFQFSADGNHLPYQKLEGLKLEGDVLHGPDGKELEFKIEWHDSIYGYGKNQYFCKLTAQGKEKVSGQERDGLLQLKHYNGIIADPSGDLPGAKAEGVWVATHMRGKGPWLEATRNELVADGHPTRLFNTVGNATMKTLVERNKFIHHQSSHGTAYCWCDGNRNFVVDTGVAGADGSNDWACPVCNKSSSAVGVIMNKDFSNLFFRSAVKTLKRAPKVLVLANCCLTAITAAYADAWIKKGVRWYIGWAIPVGDQEAVDFAKAFYRRWFGTYKLDPDKVKQAFNDVKGPYKEFRPRIFGK